MACTPSWWGLVLYQITKHPMPPRSASKQQVAVAVVVFGVGGAVVVSTFAWVAVIVTDWVTRSAALGGAVVAVAITVWGTRAVRRWAAGADGGPQTP